MTITFDPAKREITLRERGIDFATDAAKVFADRHATAIAGRFDYGEMRLKTVGWLNARMIVMIWTERGVARHIISMRFCHAKEEFKLRKELDDV